MTKDNNRKKKIRDKKRKNIEFIPNDLVQSKANVHWFYAI